MREGTEQKGRLIIVSAPSGCGKTTVVSRLVERVPGLERSVSYTTRPPREGEKNGRDYIFVSEEEFFSKKESEEFLEWEENFGSFYATGAEQVEKALCSGKDIVLSIDVKGAGKLMERYPEAISVFLLPPSKEALKERLKGRATDNEEQLALRLEEAAREMACSECYTHRIVNEDLDKAVEELERILKRG